MLLLQHQTSTKCCQQILDCPTVGRQGWKDKQTFKGHKAAVTALAFNPSGDDTFASASADHTVKVRLRETITVLRNTGHLGANSINRPDHSAVCQHAWSNCSSAMLPQSVYAEACDASYS